MNKPYFIVTSGLPGSGKSTVAEGIARALNAAILSIDPIEAAMWTSGIQRDSTGVAAYQVAAALAAENLKQGHSIVVDAVNPVEEARSMWKDLADQLNLEVSFVECHCSDMDVHRERIEKRIRNIRGMSEITWDQVEDRRAEYQPWIGARLMLDTAFETPELLIERALLHLGAIPL